MLHVLLSMLSLTREARRSNDTFDIIGLLARTSPGSFRPVGISSSTITTAAKSAAVRSFFRRLFAMKILAIAIAKVFLACISYIVFLLTIILPFGE